MPTIREIAKVFVFHGIESLQPAPERETNREAGLLADPLDHFGAV